MYEYYTAVLGAVREGLVLLDGEGRVALVNDEATRLLDLPADVVGRPLAGLGLAPGLVAAALGPDRRGRRHLPRRATGCSWSARRRPGGRGATSVRW